MEGKPARDDSLARSEVIANTLRRLPPDTREKARALQRLPLEALSYLLISAQSSPEASDRDFVSAAQLASWLWPELPPESTLNRLQQAIRKIRQGLQDDPKSPAYIETRPGLGYRYIGEILDLWEQDELSPSADGAELQSQPAPGPIARVGRVERTAPFSWRKWAWWGGTIAVVASIAFWAFQGTKPPQNMHFEFDNVAQDLAEGLLQRANPDDGRWQPTQRPGSLTLLTHQGDSWNEHGANMPIRNLVGAELPEGNFIATTRLLDFHPIHNWQQAGILIGEDLDNYVRFGLASALQEVEGTMVQQMRLSGVFEMDDQVHFHHSRPLLFRHSQHGMPNEAWLAEHGPIPELWLRVYFEDGVWSLKYSYNGTGWKPLVSKAFPAQPRFIWLAAFHGIGTVGKQDFDWDPIPAQFDFLRVDPMDGSMGLEAELK